MKYRIWIAVLLCGMLVLSACTGTQTAAPAPANLGTVVGKTDTAASKPAEPADTPEASGADEPEETPAPPEEDPGEPEESEPPEEEPETGPEEEPPEDADYTALAGIWFDEYSTEVLTIYENGGFLLQTDADSEYGYLKYTEEEGELWDPVPRYELYTEGNERLEGDAALSIDEEHPGTITCTVGAGATLFTREVPDWSTEDGLVQARYPSGPWIDCTVAEVSGEDPVTEVLFTAAGVVEDFRILSLYLKDVDQEGHPEFLVEDEYRQETLPMGWPVIALLTFYGDIPNCGFCYTDELGETHYYAVSMSGFDGSLVVSEF